MFLAKNKFHTKTIIYQEKISHLRINIKFTHLYSTKIYHFVAENSIISIDDQ